MKRFLFGSFCVIRDFTKGHFIDDSNEFIYVPTSSSSEKTHFRLPLSNRSLDKRFDLRFDLPCDRSLHPVSHYHVTKCCD